MRVGSRHGGLISGWSLIRVVLYQGGLSSGWSYIRVVSHQVGLISGWPFTRGTCSVLIYSTGHKLLLPVICAPDRLYTTSNVSKQ